MTELLIPIDLKALCIADTLEDADQTSRFAGATTNMTQLPYSGGDNEEKPFISSYDTILQQITDPPVQALKAGVHLHWALPQTMTHARLKDSGRDGGKSLDFPVVPNRWLITRLWVDADAGQPKLKSWVVESDHLSTQSSEGSDNHSPVSLMVNDDNQAFRMIGRSVALENWQPGREQASERLQDLIGQRLTAVSSGEPVFAAYYPNSMNVFGFHDSLDDLPDTATVSYHCIGWYDDPQDDLLNSGLTLAEIELQLQWRVDGASEMPETTVQKSVLHGWIQQLDWHREQSYLDDIGSIGAEVAIGNNVAEALSAWASRDLMGAERDTMEKLLTAFQLGLFSDLNDQSIDRLPDLEDALHRAGFGAQGDSTLWTVKTAEAEENAPQRLTTETPEPAPELTPELTPELMAQLSELNRLQQALDNGNKRLDSLKEQLYADWNRHGLALLDEQFDSTDEAIGSGNIWTYLRAQLDTLFGDDPDSPLAQQQQQVMQRDQLQTSLAATLSAVGLALTATAAPRHQISTEPTLLITGVDLAHRHDDLKHNAPLNCRLESETLSSISYSGAGPVAAADFAMLNWPDHSDSRFPAAVANLLLETCLLNSHLLQQVAGVTVAPAAIHQFIDTPGINDTVSGFTGTPPAAKGAQWWQGNPWLPLFLEWTVEFDPTDGSGADDSVDYSPDVLAEHFDLDHHVFTPKTIVDDLTNNIRYSGHAILTPLATQSLQTALQQVNLDDEPVMAGELTELLQQLSQTPVVFQSLSGLNQALKMRDRALQIPIRAELEALDTTVETTRRIAELVQQLNTFAPRPNSQFNPLRAGFMRLSLNVVDMFGQKREVNYGQSQRGDTDSSDTAEQSFSCAHTLRTGDSESNHLVYLPPRLMQQGQLLFRYGDADSADTGSNPLMDPVCGWVLPNHLQNTLMFYTAGGLPIGEFYLSENAIHWQSAPGVTTGSVGVEQAFADGNAFLHDFALALADKSPAAFGAFFESIRLACDHVVPEINRDPALSVLMGRPLALINAAIEVSLPAEPPVDQSWQSFLHEFDAMVESNEATVETFSSHRNSRGFHDIRLPVMVGEPLDDNNERNRVRDGLIGYFLRTEPQTGSQALRSTDFSTFYTLKADGTQGIATLPTHRLSAADPQIPMLMLLDPRARVHATSGIFPTKTLELSPHRYNQTLHNLEVSFSMAAILQPGQDNGFSFPLPQQEGYQWVWLENSTSGWNEYAVGDKPPTGLSTYTPQTLHSGWLELKKKAPQT